MSCCLGSSTSYEDKYLEVEDDHPKPSYQNKLSINELDTCLYPQYTYNSSTLIITKIVKSIIYFYFYEDLYGNNIGTELYNKG